LIIAPVKDPKEILDIGCGTGLWAVEVADEYPQSQVQGIDISPVQPLYVPDNCSFILENFLSGSSFHDEKFDLIQSRCIGAGIADNKWSKYISEIWRITKPGGWLQLVEMDFIPICDGGEMPSALRKWTNIVSRVLEEKYEITSHAVLGRLREQLQNAGFISINQGYFRVPLGKRASGLLTNV